MKKTLLRILGLVVIVLLSRLPVATAADGDCHIYCCNGYFYHGPVPAGFNSCCEYFGALCGFVGTATYKMNGWENFCPSYETC